MLENKLYTRLLLIISWIAGFISLASAQHVHEGCEYIVRGKVEGHHHHEELPGASIWIAELKTGTATDKHGNFEIKGICAGTYTIQCSHLGCKTKTVQVKIERNQAPVVVNFNLEMDEKMLQEVEITHQKSENDQHTQSTTQLQSLELDKTRGQSLGESLTKITGVTVIQTGASIAKPVIQGMYGNRILIMNNGVRQEGQQWGVEHAPEIDPFVANRITVVKGASGVRYGADAIGGVVMVSPKPLCDNTTLGGEINLTGASNSGKGVVSGLLEGKIPKLPALTWRIQGSLQKAGNVRTPNYYLKNTGMHEANFSAAVGYLRDSYGAELFYSQYNSKLGIFSGAHVATLPDLQVAMNSPEPLEKAGFTYKIARPYQDVQHELFKVKAYLASGKLGKFNFVYSRQFNYRAEYDKHPPRNDSLAALNLPELQYKLTTHSGEILLDHKGIGNFFGTIGVSGMTQANTYRGRLFIPNFRTHSGGIFLIEHWEKKNWHLEAGLRYDYRWMQAFIWEKNNTVLSRPQYNFSSLSGTVGAKYTFTNDFFVSINAASAWRAPSINEMFSSGLHQGIAALEIGDRNLDAERAYHFSANFNYNTERISTEVSFYNKWIDNYIYLAPDSVPQLTIRGAFPVFHYRQSDAVFRGMDASAEVKLTAHLSYQFKASVVRAFNRTAHDYLIWIPADRYENGLSYKFKDIKKIKNTYLTLSTFSVSRQRRVPEKSDYKLPPAGYTLFNLEAGFTVHLGRQPLQFGFGVRNMFNTAYRDYMNRFRYFADEMGRNVTVRVKMPLNFTR